MSKVAMPAVDAARVKVIARNVQRRHQDLGTSISLNHAYEAVATVFGFETWSRFKTYLEHQDIIQDEKKQTLPVLLKGVELPKLDWEQFIPSDSNPCVLLVGPSDDKHMAIIRKLMTGAKAGNDTNA